MPAKQLQSNPLFLASANRGKIREFRSAAHLHGLTVDSLPGFREIPPCVEDGTTFEENARKKAIYYSGFTDRMVFADDSGLCVDALGGRPGIHSARFSGPEATDDSNNRKLLVELVHAEQGHNPLLSAAHYECVIALAQGGRVIAITEGRVDGAIVSSPAGSKGFGYDPYFYYAPLNRTFAELTPHEKFLVSHRGKAFRSLLEHLANLGIANRHEA